MKAGQPTEGKIRHALSLNDSPMPEERRASDLQQASPSVVALAREYSSGDVIGYQRHLRGQLLYGVAGVMRVRTPGGMWLVPPLRALWIPPDVEHDVTMLGRVSMRTIYIKPEVASKFGASCRLMEVSRLLRELILALIEEPVEYRVDDRGGILSGIILLEMASAPTIPIEIPWPSDERLVAMCEKIIDNPGDKHGLDDWASSLGISERTLIRLFQRETGLQFRRWLQQVHLAEALSCLSRGVSITEISSKLGYANPSAFTCMFRKALAASPSRYLKQYNT